MEADPLGTVPDTEAHERVSTGDQHRTRRRTRKEWPDLIGRPRVVQHHEHAPTVEQRTVASRPLVELLRDVDAGDAQRSQEPRQRVLRRERSVRSIAAEVDVELSVGEPVANSVRPPHGQRRLAYSRGAGQRGDHRRVRCDAQQAIQRRDLVLASGEAAYVRRQLRRDRHRDGPAYSHIDRFAGEDLLLDRPQFGARLETQLVHQPSAGVLVDLQGVGLATAAIERRHQQRRQALPQRISAHEVGELVDDANVVTAVQLGIVEGFGR